MQPIHLGLIDGAILIVYFAFVLGIGFALRATPAIDAHSLGANINLIWGGVMIAFAVVCLWLARRAATRRK